MYQYAIIIYYSRDDEAYIAEVPELAGWRTLKLLYLNGLKRLNSLGVQYLNLAADFNMHRTQGSNPHWRATPFSFDHSGP